MNLPPSDGLLDHAKDVLNGSIPVPGGHSARLAAVLARQALEDIVRDLCGARGNRLEHPVKMKSRLIVLSTFYDGWTASTACVAWNGLSNACHHHAFQLTPTVGEVLHLINLVVELNTASKTRPN
ncbi:hypothetical protein SAMN05216266_101777 [Amycolatopsis marina]|uniref:DUF4145 domain-containing protein n=1 Tax=Amycolatopsis marina TaxID=490629 RepID=A0A1I0W760_9PSEU|nr:hypothetical protein [Amycolatopsis marina]SFA84157.1 hypothetical protein SAMN05216266_101777 [Amycolatopsis marina]